MGRREEKNTEEGREKLALLPTARGEKVISFTDLAYKQF